MAHFGAGKVSIQADAGYDLEVAYTFHQPKNGQYIPQAPVLLLAHPFANSQEYWQPQLDDAELGTFAMLTVDCPGHGGSTTRGRPWTHWDWARAMLLILDKLEILRVVTIGVSQGGFTSYRLALLDAGRAGILKERKVVGVVSCGSSIEEEAPDFVEHGMRDQLVTIATSGKDGKPASASDSIDTFASGMVDDQILTEERKERIGDWPDFGRRTITKSMKTAHGNDDLSAQLKANFNALLNREGLTERLEGGLRCPVLVLHGSADVAYSIKDGYHQRQVDVLQAAGTPVKLEMIEGAPHFTSLTAWKEFDRLVLDFVNSLA